MKRKFIELEVDTSSTNKQLKVKDSWKEACRVLGIEIIQIKVNAVSDWKRK